MPQPPPPPRPPPPHPPEPPADSSDPCPSSTLRVSCLADHDRGLHLRMQRAEVGVAAGPRERPRERLLVAEPRGGEVARRRGDRVRPLAGIRPRAALAAPAGRPGRPDRECLPP